MLSKLIVGNFKAIGPNPIDLELRPLTLLVGKNGSGKSSSLEGLALLAQSVRPAMKFGLETQGPLVSEDEAVTSLHHAGRVDQPLIFGVGWQRGNRLLQATWAVLQEGMTGRGLWTQKLEALESGESITISGKGPHGSDTRTTIATLRGGFDGSVEVKGNAGRFLDEGLFTAADPAHAGEAPNWLSLWREEADYVAEFLKSDRVRFVSALRGGLLMSREATGSPTRAGRHGEDTIRRLNILQGQGSREQQDLLSQLAVRFGLNRIAAHWSGGTYLDVKYDDPVTAARLDVVASGFGSQQALPVLTDLMDAEPGSIVIIEELEHSSHPEWVAAWGETLAEIVAKRKIQIVATTHAPTLVLAVCLAIKRGIIPASDVAIYQFERDENGSRAERLPIDEHGVLTGGWVDTFAKAERKLFGALTAADDGDFDPPSDVKPSLSK